MSIIPVFWAISAALVFFSAFLCAVLSVRRYIRNAKDRIRERHNETFDDLIADVLNNPGDDGTREALLSFRGWSAALTRSMLNYFRTVRGRRADTLRALIWNSALERQIIKATRHGTRGRRMRALQVLSYLESEAAFDCIRRHLKSRNGYERLTAARALARQKSFQDCAAIVASLAQAFPKKPDLISEVLVNFGAEVQPGLEDIIRKSNREVVKSACLETLVLLSPAATKLDLSELMGDPSGSVRASAVSLSAVCDDASGADLLPAGLSDPTIEVKIRSAKIACEVSRRDLAPQLYGLTKDPSFWVRYWAIRGIWKLGRTGQQMVRALAKGQEIGSEMAANVALEMEAGRV